MAMLLDPERLSRYMVYQETYAAMSAGKYAVVEEGMPGPGEEAPKREIGIGPTMESLGIEATAPEVLDAPPERRTRFRSFQGPRSTLLAVVGADYVRVAASVEAGGAILEEADGRPLPPALSGPHGATGWEMKPEKLLEILADVAEDDWRERVRLAAEKTRKPDDPAPELPPRRAAGALPGTAQAAVCVLPPPKAVPGLLPVSRYAECPGAALDARVARPHVYALGECSATQALGGVRTGALGVAEDLTRRGDYGERMDLWGLDKSIEARRGSLDYAAKPRDPSVRPRRPPPGESPFPLAVGTTLVHHSLIVCRGPGWHAYPWLRRPLGLRTVAVARPEGTSARGPPNPTGAATLRSFSHDPLVRAVYAQFLGALQSGADTVVVAPCFLPKAPAAALALVYRYVLVQFFPGCFSAVIFALAPSTFLDERRHPGRDPAGSFVAANAGKAGSTLSSAVGSPVAAGGGAAAGGGGGAAVGELAGGGADALAPPAVADWRVWDSIAPILGPCSDGHLGRPVPDAVSPGTLDNDALIGFYHAIVRRGEDGLDLASAGRPSPTAAEEKKKPSGVFGWFASVLADEDSD